MTLYIKERRPGLPAIRTAEQLELHPLRGALFESWISGLPAPPNLPRLNGRKRVPGPAGAWSPGEVRIHREMRPASTGGEEPLARVAVGESQASLSRRFQTERARLTDDPWNTATGEDLRYPGVVGERCLAGRLDKYVTRLYKVCSHDPEVLRASTGRRVCSTRPVGLLLPEIMLRVLRG